MLGQARERCAGYSPERESSSLQLTSFRVMTLMEFRDIFASEFFFAFLSTFRFSTFCLFYTLASIDSPCLYSVATIRMIPTRTFLTSPAR